MLEAFVAMIGALAAVMPSLVQLFMERRQRQQEASDAIIERDLTVLRTGLDRMPQ